MRYVLESEKYPGNYLVFKHGSPPHVVDLKSAQKFDNVPKALNRISTIPKNLPSRSVLAAFTLWA